MKNKANHSHAVIFDLDGTLIDTVEDIANSVNDVLIKFKYPTHSIDFYKENIGGGINDLIQKSLPKGVRPSQTRPWFQTSAPQSPGRCLSFHGEKVLPELSKPR